MKNEEKLYLAIGEIDESLISEANEGRGKKKFPMRKFSTIAASIVMTVMIGFVALAVLSNQYAKNDQNQEGSDNSTNTGENPSYSDESIPDDMVYESDIGRLTILGRDGNSFDFLLEITTDTDLPIHVNSYDKLGNNLVSSNPQNGAAMAPSITVNGSEVDFLPGKVGSYNVTITFPDYMLPDDNDTPEAAPTPPDDEYGGGEGLLPDIPGAGEDGTTDPDIPGDTPPNTEIEGNTNPPAYFVIDNFGPVRFNDFAEQDSSKE